MTLTCDAAMSNDVLQASRAAIATHIANADRQWAPERWINDLPEKQRPLVPLLMSLLDATETVARAIDDNAWDDGSPIERAMAEELANQAYRLGAVITNASTAYSASDYSLPSMSGKELV